MIMDIIIIQEVLKKYLFVLPFTATIWEEIIDIEDNHVARSYLFSF